MDLFSLIFFTHENNEIESQRNFMSRWYFDIIYLYLDACKLHLMTSPLEFTFSLGLYFLHFV